MSFDGRVIIRGTTILHNDDVVVHHVINPLILSGYTSLDGMAVIVLTRQG